jgi:4'-phosphopantetheinyl transferase EntD
VLQLGVRSDTPILRGEKGQPLWPAPVVGAISHAGGYAAAASTIASDISAIGLDMEQSHREVPLSFAKRICVPEEAVWALAEPADTSRRLVRLFSAKEAFYKAVFPLLGTLIRFKDVKLVWNEDRQLFEGTLLLHLSDDFPADYSFEITLEQTHDFLLSVVVIKR